MFQKYWLKLKDSIEKISESVKTDRILQSFIVVIVFLLCIEGVILLVWGEPFSGLYQADVPFVWYVLIGFVPTCIFFGSLIGRSYWFHLILLQLLLLSCFVLYFDGAYLFIHHSPKIVNGLQMGEMISADSSYIALFLILAGLSMMIGYCASEQTFKMSCQMIVGILAIVGILLPDILSSYRIVKAVLSGCGDNSRCGDEGVLSSLSLIESTLAAAALAMLFFLSSFFVPLYARRYFRKGADSAAASHSISGNSGNLLKSSDGSISAVSSVVSDGSAEEVNALEGSSSGSHVIAESKKLMTAAVSGLVAGACFSVASRLFSRR